MAIEKRTAFANAEQRFAPQAKRSGTSLLLVLLLAACASENTHAPGATREPPSEATSPLERNAPAEANPIILTLITGDRVRVLGEPQGKLAATIMPGKGREHVRFLTTRKQVGKREELSVVPADARRLLDEGKVDPRLFNISLLIEQRFDDAHTAKLPLIVRSSSTGAQLHGFEPHLAQTARFLPSVGAHALVQAKQHLAAFWAALTARKQSPSALSAHHGITKVWLDGRAELLLDESVPQIGAPGAHLLGFTGKDVIVALLDSGVRLSHPDLDGRVAESKDFTDSVPTGDDDVGHGTHVASIIAGSGAASAGRYRGVAPDATLINGKVCGTEGCSESAIIAGMEWASTKARIVNMSLGGIPTDGSDPVSEALNSLTRAHGTLFVVAAGNDGGGSGGVGSPAAADEALAVANVTKQGEVSEGSSRGPRAGDYHVKPDIAAPGTDIVAARASGTPLGDADVVDEHYTRLSGTSMATPHVAGAAAILAQQHPTWRAAELKAALMSTSDPIANATVFEQGVGLVDLVRATSQRVFATTPSVSFGIARYPYDEPAVTKTITFRNDGDADVTLDLAFGVKDGTGAPAPAMLFSLTNSRVVAPSHGTVDVGVVLDASLEAPSGLYTGHLSARADAVDVEVALGAYVEPESYDLTIRSIVREGTEMTSVYITDLDHRYDDVLGDVADSRVFRLPRGRYDVAAIQLAPDIMTATYLAQLGVSVHADTTITLDGRLGNPVSVTVERPSPNVSFDNVTFGTPRSQFSVSGGHQPYVVPTAPLPDDRLVFDMLVSLRSLPSADIVPHRYNLAFRYRDRIPAPILDVRDKDLEIHNTHYNVQGAPADGARCDEGFSAGSILSLKSCVSRTMPGFSTDLFTADPNVKWSHSIEFHEPGLESASAWETIQNVPTAYANGREVNVEWNRAPLGPIGSAARQGDVIIANVALFSPSEDGHFSSRERVENAIQGTTTLSKDGQMVGTSDQPGAGEFAVPAEPGRYTLSTTATRNVPWSVLATKVEASWTFHSEPPPDFWPQPLPLIMVRAVGAMDEQGIAPGGRAYPLALQVRQHPDATQSLLTELTLAVSYDDGTTWLNAVVERTEEGARAVLEHPPGDGFVSLRVSAADAAGNRVEQTVHRAYQFHEAGDPELDAGMDPELDAGMDPELDAGMDPESDASVDPKPDAGAHVDPKLDAGADSGIPDADSDSGHSGGGGCSVAPHSNPQLTASLLVMAVWLMRRRLRWARP